MTRIEDQLEMLAAAPPLRPRLPMSLLARRSSRIRQQRLRRLAALSVAVLVVGGGLGATLALAGGPSTIRIAAVTVPGPSPLAAVTNGNVVFAPGRSLVFAGTVVSGSQSVYIADQVIQQRGVSYPITNQNILVGPLTVSVSEYLRGSGPSTVLVDNHVSLNGTTLDVPASAGGWGLIVGQKLVFSGDLEPNGQVNMDACATVSGSPSEVASIIKYTYPFQPGTDPLDVFSSSGVPTSSHESG